MDIKTIENDHYIYYEDGRIYSKCKKSFLKFHKTKNGYLLFSDYSEKPKKSKRVNRVIYEKIIK